MEWLQKILANAVYGEDGKLDIEATMKKVNEEAPKHVIPKDQYNGKVEELKTANDTIADLKKSNADNEMLQQTIKDHEETIKNLQKKNGDMQKTYALRDALAKEGCSDPDYLIYRQGGLDKFTFDKDGKPLGVKELIEPMRSDNPLLFPKNGKESHYTPQGGSGHSGKNPFEKDSFNLTEQGRMFRENPEQARAMAAAAGVQI